MFREEASMAVRLMTPENAVAKGGLLGLSLTPVQINAALCAEQNFTVAGLKTSDRVIVADYNTGNATGLVGARVSAANTLTLRFVNPTAGNLTPGAGTYYFEIIRNGS